MDLRNDDLEQRAEADRREVDPPIAVESATWSAGGQLDWWVKNGRNGGVAYAVRTAGNGGSELLIFVPRAAQSHHVIGCHTSLVRHACALYRSRW
jgi:hypothetical protein